LYDDCGPRVDIAKDNGKKDQSPLIIHWVYSLMEHLPLADRGPPVPRDKTGSEIGIDFMNDIKMKKLTADRIRVLNRERAQLLSLPPEKALDRILEALHPAALVHSLPEEDFYFLVHDIGPDDALPLLSLASESQLEYILDIEGWHQDRIQMPALTKWLELMMRAQPQRFVSWLVEEKTEFAEFFLHKNVQLLIREHDEDPSDFGEDFFTFDDVYYARLFRDPLPIEGEAAGDAPPIEESEERRLTFLRTLLNRIADNDHVWYQQLMMNASGVLPAEAEEELYRLRNVRLAEKGFLPFDEAIGVYQPLAAKDLLRQPAKVFSHSTQEVVPLPVPHYPAGMLGEKTPFSDALRLVDSDAQLEQLQLEFALLCNQIIAADQRLIRDKTLLREMVRKACGYLSLGLEALVASESSKDTGSIASRWAACITRFPLSQIFRVGYGRVLHSQWQVQGWQKKAWFMAHNLPLSFWGEKWMGILGGLLIKKPRFFDNYQSGRLYREFESLADIDATEEAVTQIMEMDALLSRMAVPCRISNKSLLTYKSLLLTLWARHYLTLSTANNAKRPLVPLKKDEFIRFFKDLFGVKSEASPKSSRKTVKSMKASFLNWLSECSGDSAVHLTGRLGSTLEALFEELDTELGGVGIRDLDPRFIYLFHIK
jgi:hypothetical protein